MLILNSGAKKIEKHCISHDSAHYRHCDFAGSIYEKAIDHGKPLIVEDLTNYPNRTAVEEKMIQEGVKNVLVAPLYYQDELIRTLDLQSPNTRNLNEMNAIKLWEILPLFSVAIKRSIYEFGNGIQAVIKEKCTAIHPFVEWLSERPLFGLLRNMKTMGIRRWSRLSSKRSIRCMAFLISGALLHNAMLPSGQIARTTSP